MEEFNADFKERLVNVIKRVVVDKQAISDSDAVIYFHWARHRDEPQYDFVPKEYR